MELLLLSSSRTAAGDFTDYMAEVAAFAGFWKESRDKVKGGAKYIGWSAGANLAYPTIKTTNDMPIVDPGGLEALGSFRSRSMRTTSTFRCPATTARRATSASPSSRA
jgi:hypothetical protein